MGLVARLEAAEDGDRVFDVRLADEDGLEAPFEARRLFRCDLRYSSSVVAPMQRSSPRARAGLRRLAASVPPSAAPAPITVWSSSMNRITWPAIVTSRRTALSRSSNSPRNLVPATSAPMSSAITRFS